MKCPFCGSEKTRVIDSRPAEDNASIRRRRLCDDCAKRFTTYEKVETIPLMVVKKNGNRDQYSRRKVERGVMMACHKRPVPPTAITRLVDDVEAEVLSRADGEIESRAIGEIVMERLKNTDTIAYVRFTSVYKEFKDVSTFMDELKMLLDSGVA